MKKFMMALAAIAAIALVGCSKDDKKDDGNIVGTTWTYKEYYDDEMYVQKITFVDNQSFKFDEEMYVNNRLEDSRNPEYGTYVYNAPQITLNIDGYVMRGTISGKTMSLTDSYGDTTVYTKN